MDINGGHGDVFAEGQKDEPRTEVTNSRKRYRISTGGESRDINMEINMSDYKSLPIDDKLSVMYSQMNIHKNKISNVENKIDHCLQLHNKVTSLEHQMTAHESRLKLLEYKTIDMEARGRRNNLIFGGFDEFRHEDCHAKIMDFLIHKLQIDQENCY